MGMIDPSRAFIGHWVSVDDLDAQLKRMLARSRPKLKLKHFPLAKSSDILGGCSPTTRSRN